MLRNQIDQILDILLEACKSLYRKRLVSLGIFGSVGRGTPHLNSDIDILIVADDLPYGRIKRIKEFESVESKLSSDLTKYESNGLSTYLSPVIKTREEVLMGSLLFLDMIDDIRLLYDKDNFFKKQGNLKFFEYIYDQYIREKM